MARLLVVDDDPRVQQMLKRYLAGEGYDIVPAGNIRQAQQMLARQPVDLALLDLKLGGDDGLDLGRYIKDRHPRMGLIILSSKDDVVDKIVGLELGADDYVAKPFHLRELLARIKTVLRRLDTAAERAPRPPAGTAESSVAHFGGWKLQRHRRLLLNGDGEEVPLTGGEYKLLDALVCNAQRVLSRDTLLDLVADRLWEPYDRSVDTQIRRLRKKIEGDPAVPRLIKTVRGEGYIFSAEVEFFTDDRP